MAEMFDYLRWRGDLPFSQVGINNVDSLVFSALAYVRFDGFVSDAPGAAVPLRDVARDMRALPDLKSRGRVEHDVELLQAAADTERFGNVGIGFYQSVFIPEEETQFSAVTFLPGDGTAFLVFRGTDSTLVGWKEDFNMSFQESVPAQRLAREYVERFAAHSSVPLRLGGHSKGGNLAVYAGAKSAPSIQDRILAVYNHDGPGFTQQMMTDPGYLRIVPKVKTFVPQSSVIGMLLEHEEPYTVIRSKSVGLLQHDPYSWEIMGRDFLRLEELNADSRFLDKTFKAWLAGMSTQERSDFVDAVFALLMTENANRPRDVMRPQNIWALLKTLHVDESRRKLITSALQELVEAAKQAQESDQGAPLPDHMP